MSGLSVEVLTDHAGLERLRDEWSDLHHRCGERNAFAHPGWLLPWARLAVRQNAYRVMAVRSERALVGVLPLFIARSGPVRFLRMLGTGPRAELIELPGLVAAENMARRVVRAAVGAAHEDPDWDVLELVLAPGQGWLDPQLMPGSRRSSLIVHKGVRPCVMLDLPETRAQWTASLKRNLRSSLNRARNQLDRSGEGWEIVRSGGTEAVGRIEAFLNLHTARAALAGKVRHPSCFADHDARQFLRRALADAGRRDAAAVYELRAGGTPVAAQIALYGERAVHLGWSGNDPAWWNVSVGTVLTAEIIGDAIDRGHRFANLSPGIDFAKLRWGEEIDSYHELLAVRDTLRARTGFGAFWPLRAAAEIRRETRRHRQAQTA